MSELVTIRNNTPRFIHEGIRDESIVPLTSQPEQLPQHLPLMYVLAQKGPMYPVLVVPSDYTRLYGAKSLDVRSPYYTHATELLKIILSEGNACFVKRLAPGAKTASLTLVAELTEGTIYEYQRDPLTGVVLTDANGNQQFTTNLLASGFSVKLRFVDTQTFWNATTQTFDFALRGTSTPTITYPLMTFDGSSPGIDGNKTGIRLWTETMTSSTAPDTDVITDQGALLYAGQLVYKADNTTAITVDNIYGSRFTEFMFKPKAFNYKTDGNLTIQNLINYWTNDGKSTGATPIIGPLASITAHESNLEAMLAVLQTAEAANVPNGVTAPTMWMIDFLSGANVDGINYYGFQLDPTGDRIAEGRTYYLVGGTDGDTSLTGFDAAVGEELDFNFENPDYPLMDTAQYPFSDLYDSGFSLPVKKKFASWLGRRNDVRVTLGTHTVGEATLTVDEEISIGISLRSYFSVFAESVVHATPVCRVVMMMQSGDLMNSSYTERVSQVFALAKKRAMYGGAANGALKSGNAYDLYPNNRIDNMKNLSAPYLSNVAKEAVWSTGLNFCLYEDRFTMMLPGLQTLYEIKNSMLTSDINIGICVDVMKKQKLTWFRLTGSILPDAEFIVKSNDTLAELTAGIYDDRVVVVSQTYKSPDDTARGYSWQNNAIVYGNIMKTVALARLIARRMDSLTSTTGAL